MTHLGHANAGRRCIAILISSSSSDSMENGTTRKEQNYEKKMSLMYDQFHYSQTLFHTQLRMLYSRVIFYDFTA